MTAVSQQPPLLPTRSTLVPCHAGLSGTYYNRVAFRVHRALTHASFASSHDFEFREDVYKTLQLPVFKLDYSADMFQQQDATWKRLKELRKYMRHLNAWKGFAMTEALYYYDHSLVVRMGAHFALYGAIPWRRCALPLAALGGTNAMCAVAMACGRRRDPKPRHGIPSREVSGEHVDHAHVWLLRTHGARPWL